MKISLNWIKEFVDLDGIDEQELVKKFGLATAEVEGVEVLGKDVSGIIIARIESVEAHPNSKKLHKLKVNTGKEILDVVCGAPNVREGMKVAFAQIGANVKGVTISKASVAGEDSYGMCCAGDELGISDDHAGILDIQEDVELGTDFKSIYPVDDIVFEIDNKSLTHRPDLWCHYGIAREIATITKRPLKPLNLVDLTKYDNKPALDISVESKNCYRYSGIKIENITRKISPLAMQIRLYYTGMRAINYLADLTNYVMLEVGQPMHAFDGNFVKNIEVKEFDEDIKFTTLDEKERTVKKGSVLICNGGTPVAIAGVMGGLDSEITNDSNSVVLESASFDATSVRKTAQSIGLRTEASARYEKSLDPENTQIATSRFIKLLEQDGENFEVTSKFTDIYNFKYPTRKINTSIEFLEKKIGIKVDKNFAVDTLVRLGFIVETNGNNLSITVPSYRATKDVTHADDIVEEVARIYGYDNILPQPVVEAITPVDQYFEHNLEYETKLMLAEDFGLTEINSYIWNDAKTNQELNIVSNPVCFVVNANDKENTAVRSELAPTLIKTLNENINACGEVNIFEIARCVTGKDENNLYIEEKHLAILLSGEENQEKELFFKGKTILQTITKNLLHIEPEFELKTVEKDFVNPINNAKVLLNNQEVGYIALLHPKVRRKIEKKPAVCIIEIDFKKFASQEQVKKSSKKVTKYQTNNLDFNFVVSKQEVFGNIEKYLKNFKSDLEFEMSLIDIYEDSVLLPNKRSYTFRFNVYSFDHTLTGEELDKFSNDLIEYAKQKDYILR